jgi:hypothetical protein
MRVDNSVCREASLYVIKYRDSLTYSGLASRNMRVEELKREEEKKKQKK